MCERETLFTSFPFSHTNYEDVQLNWVYSITDHTVYMAAAKQSHDMSRVSKRSAGCAKLKQRNMVPVVSRVNLNGVQCLYHQSSCTAACRTWTSLTNCTGPLERRSVALRPSVQRYSWVSFILFLNTDARTVFLTSQMLNVVSVKSLQLAVAALQRLGLYVVSFFRATRLILSARCPNGFWPSPSSASSSLTSGIFRYSTSSSHPHSCC